MLTGKQRRRCRSLSESTIEMENEKKNIFWVEIYFIGNRARLDV